MAAGWWLLHDVANINCQRRTCSPPSSLGVGTPSGSVCAPQAVGATEVCVVGLHKRSIVRVRVDSRSSDCGEEMMRSHLVFRLSKEIDLHL